MTFQAEVQSLCPIAPGWRAIYRTDDAPGWYARPIAALAIYEMEDPGESDGSWRTIQPVVADGDEFNYGGDDRGLWYYAAPGDPDPTPQKIAEKRERERRLIEHIDQMRTRDAEREQATQRHDPG